MERRSISSIARKQARRQKRSRVGMVIFFAIFGIVGAGMLYPLGIRPIARTIDAESWPEVPCRIISAKVGEHSSDDGTTYSIDIVYEYEFNGTTYSNSRYDFIGGSSSGYNSKARVVESYRQAADPVCFVNPEQPSEAVLKRGWHLGLLLALFPLPFLAVGVGGVIWTIKSKRGGLKATTQQWLPQTQGGPEAALAVLEAGSTAEMPTTLRPKHSPWVKVFGVTFIALCWNGAVAVFIVDIVRDWLNGDGAWFATLFMIPFVLVGLGLIAGIFYQVLATTNPIPTLTLSSRVIPLGGTAQVNWKLTGRTSVIGKLRIFIRAREEARYRRGTKTYTDKNTFFEMEVFSSEDRREMAYGEAGIVVPSDSMHSFEGTNNKIIWELGIQGDIKSWPDVKEDFKITVAPAAIGEI